MNTLIFGAGKIARGFIGQLLFLSGYPFVFVEKNQSLVNALNERKHYLVNVLGAPKKNTNVTGVKAVPLSEEDEVIKVVSDAELIFTSVGGKNLKEIIPYLARGLLLRFQKDTKGYVNIITCENWKNPAKLLRDGLMNHLDASAGRLCEEKVGIAASVVLRSAIEPDEATLREHPLAVNVQDYWELPVDASAIRGTVPAVTGLKMMDAFGGFLERKLYTYNTANAAVSYLGFLKGYGTIAEAAHDQWILAVLKGIYDETGRALCLRHGCTREEQAEFSLSSLRKLQDYTIVDTLERNARDPLRKLGPEDRLVGAANMVIKHDGSPEHIANGIAAALFYNNPNDPSAVALARMRKEGGVETVLKDVCGIKPGSSLAALVTKAISGFQERNLLGEGH